MRQLKKTFERLLTSRGLELRRVWSANEPEFEAFQERCRHLPGRAPDKVYSLYQSVRYVRDAGIPGDFVECGVARGASSVIAALAMEQFADRRRMWLYDTFAGMPEPTAEDVSDDGTDARVLWQERRRDDHTDWCYGPLEFVQDRMRKTGIPMDDIEFVQGMVEDTIPSTTPDRIAILRLDTDFYTSTLHELKHLYPRLSPGGVLYVDDYASWLGARKAVDEYFAEHGPRPLLTRLDSGARIAIKPPETSHASGAGQSQEARLKC